MINSRINRWRYMSCNISIACMAIMLAGCSPFIPSQSTNPTMTEKSVAFGTDNPSESGEDAAAAPSGATLAVEWNEKSGVENDMADAKLFDGMLSELPDDAATWINDDENRFFEIRYPRDWHLTRDPSASDSEDGSPDSGITLFLGDTETNQICVFAQYGHVVIPASGEIRESFVTDEGVTGIIQGSVTEDQVDLAFVTDLGFHCVILRMERSVFDANRAIILGVMKSLRLSSGSPAQSGSAVDEEQYDVNLNIRIDVTFSEGCTCDNPDVIRAARAAELAYHLARAAQQHYSGYPTDITMAIGRVKKASESMWLVNYTVDGNKAPELTVSLDPETGYSAHIPMHNPLIEAGRIPTTW